MECKSYKNVVISTNHTSSLKTFALDPAKNYITINTQRTQMIA